MGDLPLFYHLCAAAYVGGVEVEEVEELQNKHIINEQLSFWTDFR